MNKVKFLLIGAGLFICFVMAYLAVTGVSLKERKMVKWSTVQNPHEAGGKVAMFMFSLLNESDSTIIVGDSEFATPFYEGFNQRALSDNPKVVIELSDKKNITGQFAIHTLHLDLEKLKDQCKKSIKLGCIGIKAHRLYKKKKTGASQLWITMYRVTKNSAVLFYIK